MSSKNYIKNMMMRCLQHHILKKKRYVNRHLQKKKDMKPHPQVEIGFDAYRLKNTFISNTYIHREKCENLFQGKDMNQGICLLKDFST